MIQRKFAALVTIAAFSQTACYNTYFISKGELEKLESTAEPKEVVEVYGDCPGATAMLPTQTMWAQAEEAPAEEATEAPEQPAAPVEETVASDATADATVAPAAVAQDGCTLVRVSAGNALYIVKQDGEQRRVTPFNFIMSQDQLVSPEYNLLENLSDVSGAEVDEFSTWKTVATIAGVSAVAIGTFVGISLAAPSSSGFSN
ncbi:MAG: hypothetical protein R3E66_12050 [bacterium]